jgi:tRNA(fMet)-specific endonuclease VapC
MPTKLASQLGCAALTSRVVLDTDILSEIIKGKNAVVAAKASAYVAQQGRFTTSAVSVAEIVYGLRRVGREDRVAVFDASLANTDILSFDDAAARVAGRINADLGRAGRVIGLPDVMIAAIALRNGLAGVTGNTSHFEYVRAANYDLRIENWRIP